MAMATCLGWTSLEGCNECIIPLSDSHYMSSLTPESIIFICKELLTVINEIDNDNEVILMTQCHITCTGYIYIYKSINKPNSHRFVLEYTKLVYIYTLCYWAVYYSGYLNRKDSIDIAVSIITINRMHDTYELWSEIDKIHKMLDVPMLYNTY